jgi:hypothetical protein
MASTEPRDPVTALQLQVADLCGLYTDALGSLQNEADKLLLPGAPPSVDPPAVAFAEKVVQAHREFERLATQLESAHRPEDEQLRVLSELQAQHGAVTSELRAEVDRAEAVRTQLHVDLEELLDGVLANATNRGTS